MNSIFAGQIFDETSTNHRSTFT